jgi:amidase
MNDIEFFMSTILKAEPWRYDVTTLGAPWSQPPLHRSETQKLTIGVLAEDPHFPLHPPVRRAMKSAIKALVKKGHTMVNLENDSTRDVAYGNRLAFQYFIYGPHTDNIAPSGEPLVASVAKFSSPMFTGSFPVDMSLDLVEKIDALHKARHAYTDSWRKCWVDNKIDVVLAPGAQNTATPHDTFGWPPYTVLWNLLDVSLCHAGTVSGMK